MAFSTFTNFFSPLLQSTGKSSVAFARLDLTETPEPLSDAVREGLKSRRGVLSPPPPAPSVSGTSGRRGNRGARGRRAERPGAAAARSHAPGQVVPPQRAARRRLGEGRAGAPASPGAGLFYP